jgi:hypothetical protein
MCCVRFEVASRLTFSLFLLAVYRAKICIRSTSPPVLDRLHLLVSIDACLPTMIHPIKKIHSSVSSVRPLIQPRHNLIVLSRDNNYTFSLPICLSRHARLLDVPVDLLAFFPLGRKHSHAENGQWLP